MGSSYGVVSHVNWAYFGGDLLAHGHPSCSWQWGVSVVHFLCNWWLSPYSFAFGHNWGIPESLIPGFVEAVGMGYDFASISDIIVISIEVVHGVFEPTGAIFTWFSILGTGYVGCTMNYDLYCMTSLSSLLSCQWPILICTYSGLSLSNDFSCSISLSLRSVLGFPW